MAYLGDATRDSIIQQAKDRAAASGKSAEQELWSYAQSQGISDADLDTKMGFGAGTSSAWAQKNIFASTSAPAPAPAPAPKQYLGDANRDSVISQAQQRAQQSGKSAEQELYNYASGLGYKPADIDTSMGWGAGTTQGWMDKTFKAAPQGNSYTPPAVAASTATSTATSTAASSRPYVGDANRDSIIAQAKERAAKNGTTPEQELYQYGIANGYDASGIDAAMGWGSGVTQKWLDTQKKNTPPQLSFNLNDVKQSQNWTVDPKTQTVAGQLESILASDSPLLTQARTRALQRMNATGTLNSTMATGAADSAMYDAALQIATPDARTYGDAARFNADSANQFRRDDNTFTRQGYMADFNLRANDWAADRDFGRNTQRDAVMQQYNLERDRINNDYSLSSMDKQNALQALRDQTQNAFAVARDASQNQFTTDRDASQNAFNLSTQTNADKTAADEKSKARLFGARADFTTAVNALISNKDMGEVPKQQAVDSLKLNYNTIIKQALVDLGWQDRTAWFIEDMKVPAGSSAATTGDQGGSTAAADDTATILRNTP